MVILSKKRIVLIIFCLIIGISSFFIKTSVTNIDNKKLSEVTAVPSSGKTVILDAGHGSPDEGAESKNGTTEAKINLEIVLEVQKLLEQSGTTVILTRSDENSIYDLDKKTLREKKISDIKNRVKIGNESSSDIFVSVHLNKIPESRYYGWQCFYNTKNEKSKSLAENLQKSLNEAIEKENNREVKKLESVYIMKNVEIPISIVECGFLSNPEEEQELQTKEYQEKLAWGIYIGINRYFNEID